MNLRNEVMDFAATYRALSPTSQDRYYDILTQEAKRRRDEDAVANRASQDAYKRAKQRGVGQANAAPQVAPPPTGMAFNPAAPPSIDQEIAEWSTYKRGGRVKRYDSGGQVTAEDEQAEADLILRSVMQRDIDDSLRRSTPGAQERDAAAFQTSAPTLTPTPPSTPASRAEARGREAAAPYLRAPGQQAAPLISKERVAEALKPVPVQSAVPQMADPRIAGEQETGGAPAAERPQGPYPTTPIPPSEQTPDPAVALPSVYGKVPGAGVTGGDPEVALPTTPYPTRVTRAPAGAGGGGKPGQTPNGPGTGAGTSGPSSGNGATPAPPPGASRVEDPQRRTAAFDPGRERINPNQTTAPRQLNQQGQVIQPTPQEIAQMVSTAAQGRVGTNGGAPEIGNGAVTRPLVKELVDQYSDGGRLTEGQALMAGMHAKYRVLLSQGRVKEAAQLAWGLIQASNLEAASLGMVARDQIKQGNLRAGLQSIAKAANWAPDGMTHVANGNGIDTYDQNGKLVNRMPVDGKQALALALGLADGSALWQTLQSAASLVNPPDKDAEGRALRNDLTRSRIALAEKRLRDGGKGGGSGESQQARDLRAYLASGQLPSRSSGDGGGRTNDDDIIFGGDNDGGPPQ